MSTHSGKRISRTPKLRDAEREVKRNTEAFEEAVEQLEEKIEDTAGKVRGAVDLASLPAQFLANFVGDKLLRQLRRHPTLFAAGAIGTGALILLELYLRRTQKTPGGPLRLVMPTHSHMKH